jgi:sensor domain CHASE-containing protein
MNHHDTQRGANSVLAVIALIVGVIALVVSVLAYNRAGTDITEDIEERIVEMRDSLQFEVARLQAVNTLSNIESRIEDDEIDEELQNDLNEAEQDLRQAYERAGEQARDDWQEVEQSFSIIRDNLEEDTEQALEEIRGLIQRLREVGNNN